MSVEKSHERQLIHRLKAETNRYEAAGILIVKINDKYQARHQQLRLSVSFRYDFFNTIEILV